MAERYHTYRFKSASDALDFERACKLNGVDAKLVNDDEVAVPLYSLRDTMNQQLVKEHGGRKYRLVNLSKRPTAKANLVAVESLQPGDEILAPWGRDRIDVVSESYNVAITKRKRQLPLRRNGRPNLVKRADPYAASRRVMRAGRRGKPVAQANFRLLALLAVARVAPILRRLGMSEARAAQLASTLEKARTANEAYDKLLKQLGSRADYVAKAIGLDEVKEPSVPAGYKLTSVDQLRPGDEIIVFPHGKDVVEKVSSQRKAVKTRDGMILSGKATVYVKMGRRAALTARPGRPVVYHFLGNNAYYTAQKAKRVLLYQYDVESTVDGPQLVIKMPNDRATVEQVMELLDDLDARPGRAVMPLSRRSASAATTGVYRIFVDGRQRAMIELPNRDYQLYSVSDLKRWARRTYAGQGKVEYDYLGGKKRMPLSRQTASAALPLLSVARVAPVLLRFGLTAQRAKALAKALESASTTYAAYQKLRDELGSAASAVAEALGINQKEATMNRRKVAAARRALRSARMGWLSDAAKGVEEFFGADDEEREARAGWKGASEEQKPERAKYGSLARLLAQNNAATPRDLKPPALRSFNALLQATVEKTGLPVKEVVGKAIQQAKQYQEQLSTGASRKTARASKLVVFEFESERQANAFVAEIDGRRGVLAYSHAPGSTRVRVRTMDDEFLEYYARKFGGEQITAGASRKSARASAIDDLESLRKLLVDYQVTTPARLPEKARREYYQLVQALARGLRGQMPSDVADYAEKNAVRKQARANLRRRLRLSRLRERRATAAAAWGGYKDSAKVATLKTYRVSLKVDAREGTYVAARDLAQHVDSALQAAGLNAYDVYVR